MPPLPAYGFSLARLRLALSASQHHPHRLVFGLSSARRTQLTRISAGSFSAQHALSARAVLGTALSSTSGRFMRRLGASLTAVVTAPDFVTRALQMLEAMGWMAAHRFLFGELRMHLLGWPRFLIPSGVPISFPSLAPSSADQTHSTCMDA